MEKQLYKGVIEVGIRTSFRRQKATFFKNWTKPKQKNILSNQNI